MTNKLGNVLIRSDLNVPISNGKITDNFRIKQALSSIEQISKFIYNKKLLLIVHNHMEVYMGMVHLVDSRVV